MGNFRPQGRNGFNSRGRDRGFGGDREFSRDRPQRREMHEVTCSKCGKNCQVPFKPTGNKPVFCSECFGQQNDRGNNFSQSNHSSPSVDLSGINAKLDKIIAILQELELDVVDEDSEDIEEEN